MKYLILLLVCMSSAQAMAKVPNAVSAAVKNFKATSIKSVVTEETNVDGNPCLPEGKYYSVAVKVRNERYNPIISKTLVRWETVKNYVVDVNGGIMESCAE